MKQNKVQKHIVKLAKPDDTMPYCIKLQISASDYHALVEHFSKPEREQMGRPLVAVNKVFSAYGWEENLKACAAARAQTLKGEGFIH